VLMVTDGVFSVGESTLEQFRILRARMDFRCHVLLIGDFARGPSEGFADYVWRWCAGDDVGRGTAELIHSMKRAPKIP